MNVKEYCNDDKPCKICQAIYDACEHDTVIQIEKSIIQCIFCYNLFFTSFDTNDNSIKESDDDR